MEVSGQPYVLPLCSWRKRSHFLSSKRLVGPHSLSGKFGDEKCLDAAENRALNYWSFNSWPSDPTSLDVPAVFCS